MVCEYGGETKPRKKKKESERTTNCAGDSDDENINVEAPL